ncbi:hypothetical protein LZC95_51580 [Pendulispora brunnea]|uniref:BNR repeat domain protein n=1 Tax=Pendulispora brunnea TaxID=2905690 RepID=A0ABZ2KBT0_9BACT
MISSHRRVLFAASAAIALAACDIVLPLGNTPCAGDCVEGDASIDGHIGDANGPPSQGDAGPGPGDLDPDAGPPVCDGGVCQCVGTFKKGQSCVRASTLVTTYYSLCAIADGTVYCSGQDFIDVGRHRAPPTIVPGLERDVARIAIDSEYGCAVTTAGGAKCWGYNSLGQLGYGRQDERPPKAVDVVDLATGVRDVHIAHDKTTCAVTTGGAAKCWGYNGNGALGVGQSDGGPSYSSRPLDVAGLSAHVLDMGTGRTAACAVLDDGRVMCWGDGDSSPGTYGPDRSGPNWAPFAIDGLAPSTYVGFSNSSICVLSRAGNVSCLGHNGSGLFGGAGQPHTSRPVEMSVLPRGSVAQLRVASQYACVVTTSGGVKCWGERTPGGKIEPTPQSSLDVPTLGSGVVKIGVASDLACAVMADGGVRCWGDDTYGQLGNGAPNTRSNDPVAVVGLPEPVFDIDVGSEHVCALTRSGHVWCWGSNTNGIFADSDAIRITPVPVPLLSR